MQMEFSLVVKKNKIAFASDLLREWNHVQEKIDGTRGPHAKQNKPDSERQIIFSLDDDDDNDNDIMMMTMMTMKDGERLITVPLWDSWTIPVFVPSVCRA